MALQEEVIKAFLEELRKYNSLKTPLVTGLERMLNSQSVTKKKLLELIETNATLQNKES